MEVVTTHKTKTNKHWPLSEQDVVAGLRRLERKGSFKRVVGKDGEDRWTMVADEKPVTLQCGCFEWTQGGKKRSMSRPGCRSHMPLSGDAIRGLSRELRACTNCSDQLRICETDDKIFCPNCDRRCGCSQPCLGTQEGPV